MQRHEHSQLSEALYAANERLMEIRAKQGIAPSIPARPNQHPRRAADEEGGGSGWLDALAARIEIERADRERQSDEWGTETKTADQVAVGASANCIDLVKQSEIEVATLNGDRDREKAEAREPHHIKIMPSLMNGISRAGMDAAGRVWLLMREIDEAGRGWLSIDDVRDKLTSKTSIYRVCGQRRLRQILRAGEGRLWERDGYGRMWIYGAAKACENFDVERLVGDNIEVELDTIRLSIKSYRAAIYGAFLASKRDAPISRAAIEEATGFNERTQREFDQIIGTKKTRNFSIDTVQTAETKEEHVWQYGRGHFEFIDYKGKQGEKGQTYNARRLPNSYETPFQCGAAGRKKKTNRKLKLNLVNQWAQGNEDKGKGRLFYTDGRTAGAAIKRSETAIIRHSGRKDFAFWTTYEGDGRDRSRRGIA